MEFIFSKWQLEAFTLLNLKMNFFETSFSGFYQDF